MTRLNTMKSNLTNNEFLILCRGITESTPEVFTEEIVRHLNNDPLMLKSIDQYPPL